MFHHDFCVIGRHYKSGECVLVSCRDGDITEVREIDYLDEASAELPLIGPGFVDLQVNGMKGEDFNGDGVHEDTTARITAMLWAAGVTSYCPTVITESSSSMERSLSLIASSLGSGGSLEAAAIAGIHLEGPFISPLDGARGAHVSEHIQPPDWELFQSWNAAAEGRIKLVTLSPEWPQSVAFIKKCKAMGITVSIGHTAASHEQLDEAAAAGASMCTHFGNGAPPVLPRHPNILWSQLSDERLACSVIADGFHLPDTVLKVVRSVKGCGMVLVSDAVQLCGMPPGRYRMPVGGDVALTERGRLHLVGDERLLAGSARPLIDGFNHLVSRGICDLAEAWEAASVNAARQLNLPQSRGLASGAPADLTLLMRKNGRYEVFQTVKRGMTVYKSKARST